MFPAKTICSNIVFYYFKNLRFLCFVVNYDFKILRFLNFLIFEVFGCFLLYYDNYDYVTSGFVGDFVVCTHKPFKNTQPIAIYP